ncbi:MAG: DUF4115 domain-containing protein [Kaiparowitsia implicata GSE-PSE-MK54-09C]|jgi:cytoskeletal protein RodZ|nr:DUF4115 domain-containing protein [Kaiparowitsia implicata GSE-PSE-MK54-09C]
MSKGISQLEQLQQERLQQIGDYLMQVRQDAGLTIDHISAKTLIQSRLLNAIEAGNMRILPEPVYVRGFIKRYADALGLSGEEVAQSFPVDAGRQAVVSSWKETPAAQLGHFHLWMGYAAIITAAVIGLSFLINRNPSNSPVPVTDAETTLPSVASPPPALVESPVAEATPATPQRPVEVEVMITSESWVRVRVDGRTDFEGMLQEGTQRSWAAEQEIELRAGNAGGVIVIHNNRPAEPMGRPGIPETVVYTPQQTDQAANLP